MVLCSDARLVMLVIYFHVYVHFTWWIWIWEGENFAFRSVVCSDCWDVSLDSWLILPPPPLYQRLCASSGTSKTLSSLFPDDQSLITIIEETATHNNSMLLSSLALIQIIIMSHPISHFLPTDSHLSSHAFNQSFMFSLPAWSPSWTRSNPESSCRYFARLDEVSGMRAKFSAVSLGGCSGGRSLEGGSEIL